MALVEVRDIRKVYRRDTQEVPVLDGLSLDIEPGDFVALMGPSGSGKTTLLNLIGGVDQPTSGQLRVAGEEIGRLGSAALAKWRARHIGYIFQLYNLIPVLTALQNVELPMVFAGVGRGDRRRRVEAALASVSLTDRAGHRPDQLSGGERQLVALARATVMGPRVLLADEPTGNLDSASGRQILDLLDRMNGDGITLVVVTHDPNVARRADRAIILVDGRIARRLPGAEIAGALDLLAPAGGPA